MWEFIVSFFGAPPPALDPLFVPWIAALIAGNVIIGTGLWALFKYIAKLTQWAQDDKIIQIITGAYDAIKGAVSKERELPEFSQEPKCEKCGK